MIGAQQDRVGANQLHHYIFLFFVYRHIGARTAQGGDGEGRGVAQAGVRETGQVDLSSIVAQ